jgi:hypothetical protein
MEGAKLVMEEAKVPIKAGWWEGSKKAVQRKVARPERAERESDQQVHSVTRPRGVM